jgi:hypothetical protein
MAAATASVASGNPDDWIQRLLKRELPHINDIRHLCSRAREELSKEANVLQVG